VLPVVVVGVGTVVVVGDVVGDVAVDEVGDVVGDVAVDEVGDVVGDVPVDEVGDVVGDVPVDEVGGVAVVVGVSAETYVNIHIVSIVFVMILTQIFVCFALEDQYLIMVSYLSRRFDQTSCQNIVGKIQFVRLGVSC